MNIMNITVPETLKIDDVEYPVASFSENVQRLVLIHTKWRGELQDERLAVTKTEAAIRVLENELNETLRTELAAKVKPSEAETE